MKLPYITALCTSTSKDAATTATLNDFIVESSVQEYLNESGGLLQREFARPRRELNDTAYTISALKPYQSWIWKQHNCNRQLSVIDKIAEALHSNTTLEILDLQGYAIDSEELLSLAKAISLNQHLRELKISQDKVVASAEAEEALAAAIVKNESLVLFTYKFRLESLQENVTKTLSRNAEAYAIYQAQKCVEIEFAIEDVEESSGTVEEVNKKQGGFFMSLFGIKQSETPVGTVKSSESSNHFTESLAPVNVVSESVPVTEAQDVVLNTIDSDTVCDSRELEPDIPNTIETMTESVANTVTETVVVTEIDETIPDTTEPKKYAGFFSFIWSNVSVRSSVSDVAEKPATAPLDGSIATVTDEIIIETIPIPENVAETAVVADVNEREPTVTEPKIYGRFFSFIWAPISVLASGVAEKPVNAPLEVTIATVADENIIKTIPITDNVAETAVVAEVNEREPTVTEPKTYGRFFSFIWGDVPIIEAPAVSTCQSVVAADDVIRLFPVL
ncbi:hypothetical protein HDU79_009764 [Rhizoclosmatium sp. JEL0117]|nr:hypothetical protein HDU79_009764 [Rhizoclosmatium sp. JEL0117]